MRRGTEPALTRFLSDLENTIAEDESIQYQSIGSWRGGVKTMILRMRNLQTRVTVQQRV
jgi:hypothetical protein